VIDISKYKAVLFDLYGTLVEIQNPISPYKEIMRLCNLGDSDKQKFKTLAMTTKLSIDEICKEFGVSLSADAKSKFEADIELELKSIVIKQDTNDILDNAKALGLKTAIISNLAKEYGQPSCLFDVDLRVLSFEVGMLKPNTEIFKFALEHFGLEAKDCLMIGDKDQLDLEPFRKLGGDTCLIARI
jgi:HAD superfamily hydrolase (TIGR01509 family)